MWLRKKKCKSPQVHIVFPGPPVQQALHKTAGSERPGSSHSATFRPGRPPSAPASVRLSHSTSQARRVSSGHSPRSTGAQQWDKGALQSLGMGTKCQEERVSVSRPGKWWGGHLSPEGARRGQEKPRTPHILPHSAKDSRTSNKHQALHSRP